MTNNIPKIILAFSGGLDTSVAAHWLKDQRGYEVHCLTIDLGNLGDLDGIRKRAEEAGAASVEIADAKDTFIRYFIWPALQAGVVYEGRYPLATALGRPLIAKMLVDKARQIGATAVAHGCTGKGNDQVRLDVGVQTLAPDLDIVGTTREHSVSRDEALEYAAKYGIHVRQSSESPYSTDENLWGRSIECGVLEDPWVEPPEDIYTLTKSPMDAPDVPAYVEVEFTSGVPTKVNGVSMPLTELINSLETIAGTHGIGRIDMVENRLVGIKSREIYEAPAACVLHAAHRELETLVIPRDLERLKVSLSKAYADLVYDGLWFSVTRESIDAFVASIQKRVSGVVKVKLFKGDCRVVGRKSPMSLYDTGLATYDEGDQFDHEAAEGFIKIFGLPIENAGVKRRALEAKVSENVDVEQET